MGKGINLFRVQRDDVYIGKMLLFIGKFYKRYLHTSFNIDRNIDIDSNRVGTEMESEIESGVEVEYNPDSNSNSNSKQDTKYKNFHSSKKNGKKQKKKGSHGKKKKNMHNVNSFLPSQIELPPNFFSDLKYNSLEEREEYLRFLHAKI